MYCKCSRYLACLHFVNNLFTFSGLYHGLIPTFARDMPGYFFFFFAYEASRELLTPAGKLTLFLQFKKL